jgi:hypothetical protein
MISEGRIEKQTIEQNPTISTLSPSYLQICLIAIVVSSSPLPPAEPPIQSNPTRIPHPNSDRPRLTPPYHSPPRPRPPDVTAQFLPSSTTAPIHNQPPIPQRHKFLFQPSASDRQGQSPGPRLPGPRNGRRHCRGSLPLCVRPVHSYNKLFASHLSPAAFDLPHFPKPNTLALKSPSSVWLFHSLSLFLKCMTPTIGRSSSVRS